MAFELRSATVADAAAISELIAPFAERDLMLPRPLPQLFEAIRDFSLLCDEHGLAACAALHVFDEELAEVKSLAVAGRVKGQGLASRLIAVCVDEARRLGVRKVFALVLRDELWRKQGFITVEKDNLPQKVWGECIFCPKFHRCDEVAVVLDLSAPPTA